MKTASHNYFQFRANREGKPVYVGPDNLNGGSHWVYPNINPHDFDSTGAEESNEPSICAFCGLDITHKIHRSKSVNALRSKPGETR